MNNFQDHMSFSSYRMSSPKLFVDRSVLTALAGSCL